ncbi:MAG: serine hydrolase domain-containing protein [Bacillota bacterium]
MHMRRNALLFLAAAALCGGASAAAKPAEPPPPQTPAELQAQLAAIIKDAGVPGAGIALFDRNGVTWTGGVGNADLDKQQPVTADTLFRVGSITKGFVAVALLQLVEKGALRLDARLHDIAPEIPVTNPWEATDPVTVAEVLEHTAGFDDMHFPRLYNFHDPADIPLLTVLQRSGPELRVRWRPGSRMAYSNPDYLIAGYLVEKFSGERYEQYVTEHVLRPLGMDNTSLAADPSALPGLAQGYEGIPPVPVSPKPIYLRPAGALTASPAELAHFGVMLLNRGRWANAPFLSAESVTRMETPETGAAAHHGLDYGYGLANYTSYIGGYEFHGHDGGIDGFTSRYAYAPDQGVGFVLLFNTSEVGEARRKATDLLVSYLMRGQPKPVMPPPAAVDAKALDAVSGWYREKNPRNQVVAVLDYLFGVGHVYPDGKGGVVLHGLFQDPLTLVPAGTDLWRVSEDPAPDTVFYTDADGETVLDHLPGAGGAYLVKTNWLSACGPLLLFFLVLVLMLSSVGFALVWLVRLLAGRMKRVRHWSLRILPLAASVSFVLMLAGVLSIEPIELGVPNAKTVGFFLFSLLFAVLSIAAMLQAMRSYKWDVNRWMRMHSTAVAAACFGMTLFLMYWGLIGLRFWNF